MPGEMGILEAGPVLVALGFVIFWIGGILRDRGDRRR